MLVLENRMCSNRPIYSRSSDLQPSSQSGNGGVVSSEIGVLVGVLAVLLLIQLSANVPLGAAGDSSSACKPVPHWTRFLALDSPGMGFAGALGVSHWKGAVKLSLSAFQVDENKYFEISK